MMRHWHSVGALALTLGFLITAQPGVAAQDPTAFTGDLGTGTQVLSSSGQQEQHLARVRELFSEDFDISEMGRFVLGRYWSEMTPDRQEEFLSLFQDYTV